MRNVLNALCLGVLLIGSAQSAAADACLEAFVKRWTAPQTHKGPVKSHNTSKITGQKPFINTNVYDPATGNWLSEMIEPASMPWSMVIGKAMYASSDQGKSWKKIRDTDEQHSPEAVRKAIEDNMKTAKNAKCGFEDLDGIRHETLEAEYTAQGNIAVQDKHWIHPETRRTVKSWSLMKQAGFETETTQVIEYLESYTFPTP